VLCVSRFLRAPLCALAARHGLGQLRVELLLQVGIMLGRPALRSYLSNDGRD
jgi:hypothetical protein